MERNVLVATTANSLVAAIASVLVGATAPVLVAAIAMATLGCAGASKLDLGHMGQRAAWQHPERVVRALGIHAGDHVVDLGAGDGYFLPYLARAVGPVGRVYAVEVDANAILELERMVADEGLDNVEIVLGDYHDPRLPDGSIDLFLLVNSYHHIEQRPAYFEQLRADLGPAGRVAVIDPDDELDGMLSLFLSRGHTSSRRAIRDELTAVGYSHVESFDFLPVQVFEVFTPLSHTALSRH
jgi:predicted methyltransferase